MLPGYSGTVGAPRTERPVTYTVAPSSPSTRAMPSPAPRVAPVTTATCPVSRCMRCSCVRAPGWNPGARRGAHQGINFRRQSQVKDAQPMAYGRAPQGTRENIRPAAGRDDQSSRASPVTVRRLPEKCPIGSEDSVPQPYCRTHRRTLALFALAVAASLLATACQGSQPAQTTALRLVITPASGRTDVNPGSPLTVKAIGGHIRTVIVTGDTVSGALNRKHTAWQSTSTLPLPVHKTFTLTVKAQNTSGKIVKRTSTFRTLNPGRTFNAKITEGSHQTYGVGMPIILTFSQPITNRAAVERALEITTSKPVVGAWYWDTSQSVYFRPREYWPANTSVSFVAHLDGVEAEPGVFGHHTLSQKFTIGRSLIVVASTATHRLKLYRD